MLMPIEYNRMNSLTMNMMPNGDTNTQNTKPLLWKNDTIKQSKLSKRVGLGKFSKINRNDCIDESAQFEELMTSTSPMTLLEQSTCSPPRRISFSRLDKVEDINPFPILETRKPRKTVRFAPQLASTVNDSPTLWYGKLTEEHCNELWYQKSELAAIKLAAKVAIANRNKVQGNPDASFEQLDELIGLERFSKQRAVWKKSAIRCVMMAQRQVNSLNGYNSISKEDYIERISSRCTAWARDTAEKQGFRDYCAVHDPLAALFSDSEDSDDEKENKQNYNELIFGETNTISNKRKAEAAFDGCSEHESMIDSGRRTRHRASPTLVL